MQSLNSQVSISTVCQSNKCFVNQRLVTNFQLTIKSLVFASLETLQILLLCYYSFNKLNFFVSHHVVSTKPEHLSPNTNRYNKTCVNWPPV